MSVSCARFNASVLGAGFLCRRLFRHFEDFILLRIKENDILVILLTVFLYNKR